MSVIDVDFMMLGGEPEPEPDPGMAPPLLERAVCYSVKCHRELDDERRFMISSPTRFKGGQIGLSR
jgi:hypothetical protein